MVGTKKENDAQNLRRAVRNSNDDVKRAWAECATHAAKKKFREQYKKDKTFDWIVSVKSHSEGTRKIARNLSSWKTESHILLAEGYTKANPDRKALANAKNIMLKAKAGGDKKCRICPRRGCEVYRYVEDMDISDFEQEDKLETKGEKRRPADALQQSPAKEKKRSSSCESSRSDSSSSTSVQIPSPKPKPKPKTKTSARASSTAASHLDETASALQLLMTKIDILLKDHASRPWLAPWTQDLEKGHKTLQGYMNGLLSGGSADDDTIEEAKEIMAAQQTSYNAIFQVDMAARAAAAATKAP